VVVEEVVDWEVAKGGEGAGVVVMIAWFGYCSGFNRVNEQC